MSSHINYRESFFQHPALTKIAGDPTYTSLAKLKRECKANAKSVCSDLGGGQQGHLGLISSAPAYAHIAPGTPSHRPALLAPPVTDGTAAVIAASRQHYDEQISAFNKCTLPEPSSNKSTQPWTTTSLPTSSMTPLASSSAPSPT